MGRQKKLISKEDIERIEKLAGLGLTVDMIANILGISKRTLERRCSENKKVSDALLKGRAVAASNVAETAYKMAVSGANPTMTIFWLKTQLKWNDKPEVVEAEDYSIKEATTAELIEIAMQCHQKHESE